jgi:transposase InsO family protein
MRTELVVDALQMALARRRPEPGLIWHSDQGSQFVSLTFGQACGKAGIARSMGSRGDCYDNAVAESFFATLKKELVHRQSWPTRRELTSAVFDYVEAFYNNLPVSPAPPRTTAATATRHRAHQRKPPPSQAAVQKRPW